MTRVLCTVLVLLVAPALLAGTTVIHVATDGNGALVANSGQVNWNGAIFWNQGWGLNDTYGHMFFMDLRTGERLKTYATTVVSPTQPASDVLVWDIFRVERRRVAMQEGAAGSGRAYTETEYRVTLAADGTPFLLLRSRPLLDDPGVTVFEVFVPDRELSPASTTALRGNLGWYVSPGTAEEVAAQPLNPAHHRGEMPSVAGLYFLDEDGGSDMGGNSIQVRTLPFGGGRWCAPGLGVFPSEVSVKRSVAGAANLLELRLLPGVEGLADTTPEVLFPGVASLAGANQTRWRSEAVLSNPTGTTQSVRLDLLPRGQSAVGASISRTVGAHQTVRYADLYLELGAAAGAGMLRVVGNVRTWVRTFNQGAQGTFGQDAQPATRDGAYPAGRDLLFPVTIPADPEQDFRSNLLLVNLEGVPVTFTIGAGASSKEYAVPAGVYQQVNNVGGWLGLPAGTSVISVRATGRWSGTISTVDPVTGDPTTVRGLTVVPWGNRFIGVASASGANQTRWRSEAVLFNPASEPAAVTLKLIPRDSATTVATKSLTLSGREARRIADVYAEIGVASGFGRLEIGGKALAWVRTFNQGSGATFGQDVPQMSGPSWSAPGATVLFPVTTPADPARDFRSNLLVLSHFNEETPETITITVRSGARTRTFPVPRTTYVQINDVGSWLGLAPGVATVEVTANGWWSGTVSSVDPVLGDPTTVVGLAP